MGDELLFLIFYECCIFISGELIESESFSCSNDSAVFVCTNYGGVFTYWLLHTPGKGSSFLGLNSFIHPEGTILMDQLGPSSLKYQTLTSNSSFIRTMVTIVAPFNVNGTIITCNGDSRTLMMKEPILLKEILIIKHNTAYNISWKSKEIKYVKASPITNWMPVNESWIILTLNNIVTQLSISQCPGGESNSSFRIGYCINTTTNTASKITQYSLHSNGNWNIFQKCHTNETNLTITPNRCYNGTWTNDFKCSRIGDTGILESYIVTNSSKIHSMTETKSTTDIQRYQLYLIIASIIVTIITISVIGITLTIHVSKCYRNRNKRRKNNIQGECLEMTYEHLSNIQRTTIDNEEYATLPTIPQIESSQPYDIVSNKFTSKGEALHYGRLNANNSSAHTHRNHSTTQIKGQLLNYFDVTTRNEATIPKVIDTKVDYSDIHLSEHPADKCLDLNSLLIQLQPVSHVYQLIGSAAGISPSIIHQIASQATSPYDGLVEVCDQWLYQCKMENIQPTWAAVADILTLIGQVKLSHDILQVYETGQLPIEVDMTTVSMSQIGYSSLEPPPLPPGRPKNLDDSDGQNDIVGKMTVRSLMAGRNVKERSPKLPPKTRAKTQNNEKTKDSILGRNQQYTKIVKGKKLQKKSAAFPPLPTKQSKASSIEKMEAPLPINEPGRPPQIPPKLFDMMQDEALVHEETAYEDYSTEVTSLPPRPPKQKIYNAL